MNAERHSGATLVAERHSGVTPGGTGRTRTSLLDPAMLAKALPDALRKLDPRTCGGIQSCSSSRSARYGPLCWPR